MDEFFTPRGYSLEKVQFSRHQLYDSTSSDEKYLLGFEGNEMVFESGDVTKKLNKKSDPDVQEIYVINSDEESNKDELPDPKRTVSDQSNKSSSPKAVDDVSGDINDRKQDTEITTSLQEVVMNKRIIFRDDLVSHKTGSDKEEENSNQKLRKETINHIIYYPQMGMSTQQHKNYRGPKISKTIIYPHLNSNILSSPSYVKDDGSIGSINKEEIDKKIVHPQIDNNGKKFIILNGKKFQIVSPSKTILNQHIFDNKLNIKTNNVSNNITGTISNNNIKTYSNKVKIKSMDIVNGKHTNKIIVDSKGNLVNGGINVIQSLDGKIIPLKTNLLNETLSQKKTENIPPVKILNNLLVTIPKNVESHSPGNTICTNCTKQISDDKNYVSTSTNTETKYVDKKIQTMTPYELVIDTFNSEWLENESKSEKSQNHQDYIIGSNVNMGTGPLPIQANKKTFINADKAKYEFYKELQCCVIWDSGNLPIHRAVIQKNLALVKRQCIALTARGIDVNVMNINKYTALHLAVIQNVSLEIVQTLLQYKADKSLLDPEGNNVIHLAVENNRNDMVKLFTNDEDGEIINRYNYDGLTPLMRCAFHSDRIDIAEILLRRNADPDLKDLKSGRTAIFHAAVNHNTPMVSLLLDYSADTRIRNFFGTSVHDAMFELEDMPQEIRYPILGRDLKVTQKRKLYGMQNQQQEQPAAAPATMTTTTPAQQNENVKKQEETQSSIKRTKFEVVPTFQKIMNAKFVVNTPQNFASCEGSTISNGRFERLT